SSNINIHSINIFLMKNLYSILIICFTLAFNYNSYAQLTYTFTNAGATGNTGPTQAQVNTAYTSTSLAGSVTATNGIQYWTVPSSGPYKIEARGAQGGGSSSGLGAAIEGEFDLISGTVLKIIV